MEAIISPMISAQQPAAVTGQVASGKATDSAGGFQKTLVQHIGAEAAVVPTDSKQAQLFASVNSLTGVSVEGALPAVEELLAMIEGLLDSLEAKNGTEESLPVEEASELEAMLDQLDALLALLGTPLIRVEAQSHANATSEIQLDKGSDEAVSNVKQNLQQALLQLQDLLQQGAMKQVQQQEPVVLIHKQLQAFVSMLNSEGKYAGNKDAVKHASQSEAVIVPQSAATATAATLLERLSQQTAHPAYTANTAAIKEVKQVNQQELTAVQSEPVTVSQLTSNQGDGARFAPVATKAVPSSYVLADEFAKTMTGMVIQKFNLTTLNGVSEAKLMLFPEHLGQVDVRITMQNGILTATFQTDTVMAKDMLESQMAQLRAALQAQGLNVDKLEVSQGQVAAQLFQQQQGQGSRQSFANQQTMRDQDAANEAAFESELIEQAAIQDLGYGRAINETV